MTSYLWKYTVWITLLQQLFELNKYTEIEYTSLNEPVPICFFDRLVMKWVLIDEYNC